MKVAVTVTDGNVSEHFGKSQEVWIYEIDRSHAVTGIDKIPVEGTGHVPVSGIMIRSQVQAVICGSIGMQAYEMVQNMHAHAFAHASGTADEAVQKLLRRELTELKVENCGHLEDEGGCSGNCASCAYH